MVTESGVILANFGGPRSLEEVESFLTELLTDTDVIQTPLPGFVQEWLFKRIARKRSEKVSEDYALIGGRSPIFEDTEAVASMIRDRIKIPVFTFHRYLPATHSDAFHSFKRAKLNKLLVIPMYPQFSYSTTGSIARFFSKYLSSEIVDKMQWIKSYPTHPSYIQAMQNCIRDYLRSKQLKESEVFLFFSAHGLPQKFVQRGDPYQQECHSAYDCIREGFPKALSLLAFQSKFGVGKWLQPYTSELCKEPHLWTQGRKHIVFVPLSFTSDHLETLFEIETLYSASLQQKGLCAYRCPALNRRADWIEALITLIQSGALFSNQALIRN